MLTKQEQKILDDAPEGAKYYSHQQKLYFSIMFDGELGFYQGGKWNLASGSFAWGNKIDLSDLRKKQRKTVVDAPKPVYTQAMKDAGELPSVGCKVHLCNVTTRRPDCCNLADHCVVNTSRNGDELVVIAKVYIGNDEMAVVQNTRTKEVSTIVDQCYKPIYTRTPEQKQVDEVVEFMCQNCNMSQKELVLAMQKEGLLAEIVKPLEE